jgi:hypothetical protein
LWASRHQGGGIADIGANINGQELMVFSQQESGKIRHGLTKAAMQEPVPVQPMSRWKRYAMAS